MDDDELELEDYSFNFFELQDGEIYCLEYSNSEGEIMDSILLTREWALKIAKVILENEDCDWNP
jgi:hypothetical protein